MNAINVPKRPNNFYSKIGTVIIDEAHLILSEVFSKSLKSLQPRYLVGLSATPYRLDGFNELLKIYFGEKYITRELFRKHTVYQIKTSFSPKVELNKQGKVNWSDIINKQSYNSKRNEMIVNLIKFFPKRNFLVICKRVDQAHFIVSRLLEEKEKVTSLIGSQKEYEKESRILVGTVSKIGVGFDHQKLDTLLLASDIKDYYIQALGRVFRSKKHIPLVFDIVDDNNILKNHWRTRRKIYLKHGGTINNFKKFFPDFEIL